MRINIRGFKVKRILMGLIIIGAILGCYGVYSTIHQRQTVFRLQNGASDDKVAQRNAVVARKYYLDLIHKMTNGLIVAEDGEIWGTIPVTDYTIDKCLECVEADYSLDDESREFFKRALTEMKSYDYHEVVELHNAAWGRLGGTIGKARSLR